MNESIPHLGAALFGNMLSTGWAGYRVYSTYSLMNLYHTDIRQKACNGKDLLGSWWEERLSDTVCRRSLIVHYDMSLVVLFRSRLWSAMAWRSLP